MTGVFAHTEALMGTVVTIQVIGHGANAREMAEKKDAVARALTWFRRVEECCTRFDPTSEVMQLTAHIGETVPVSAILFEAVQFALAVAEESNGAFDPTVGHQMESLGFNEEYRSGNIVRTDIQSADAVSYRDVRLDPHSSSITLLRPLILDLGAVAKGLAVDIAARELADFRNFAIDAGGDLYLSGCNADGEPWAVGIRHPRDAESLIETLHISDAAVCTSGDYERKATDTIATHHIIDPRTGESATALASATVVAPTAMVGDAFATAAFVLGPAEGIELLDRHGLDGLLFTPALERFTTTVGVQ